MPGVRNGVQGGVNKPGHGHFIGMKARLEKLRDAIVAQMPDSDLTPLSQRELSELLRQYPDMPEHLRELFAIVGVGRIGDGRYMIHGLLTPADIYDEQTAAALEGIVIVGDDFAGTCEAYDMTRGWNFGRIGASGEFEKRRGDFVMFLESWYGHGGR